MIKNCKKLTMLLFTSIFLFSSVEANWITKKTPKSEEFYFPNGIIDYAKKNYDKNEKIISKFFYKELKINDIERFEVYVSFNKDNKSSLSSFCNTVETPDGGSHENSLKNALLQSIKLFGKKNQITKIPNIGFTDLFDFSDSFISTEPFHSPI